MRKLPGAVLVALLIPVVLMAQERPLAPGETRMAPKKGPPWIASNVATSTALARVRADLKAGKQVAWGDPHVTPASNLAAPFVPGGSTLSAATTTTAVTTVSVTEGASVKASRTVLAPKGGKDGAPVYLVFATVSGVKGQVRVAVNATNGAVLNVIHRHWTGRATPDWWVTRLDEDPVGTTAPRR